MRLASGDYRLEIPNDGSYATLMLLNPALAGNITLNDLRNLLSENGIVFGISEEQLARFVVAPKFGEALVIAKGHAPPKALVSAVTYTFDTDNSSMGSGAGGTADEVRHEQEGSGRIDLRRVTVFNNVHEGEVLAYRTIITPLMCGMDIFGRPVQPGFQAATAPRVGRGAALDPETGTVTATVNGHVVLDEKKIKVFDKLDHNGDVDYSVGNIDFIGDVRIVGNILPGFRVHAGGNLTISGSIDRGNLFCGGDLEIRGNVFGAGESRIEVLGNASVESMDQCEVLVYGNLHASNYIRHCLLRVGGDLEISGKKGSLVGGEAFVYHNVELCSLGSKMAALTKLNVGSNPFMQQKPELLREELQVQEQKYKQIIQGIETLQRRQAENAPSQQLLDRIDKLQQAKAQFGPLLESLRGQLEEALHNAGYFREAVITVRGIVHPGVVLSFRERMQYKTMDAISHICFYENGIEIKVRSV